mgnify:CR=1 FL=1
MPNSCSCFLCAPPHPTGESLSWLAVILQLECMHCLYLDHASFDYENMGLASGRVSGSECVDVAWPGEQRTCRFQARVVCLPPSSVLQAPPCCQLLSHVVPAALFSPKWWPHAACQSAAGCSPAGVHAAVVGRSQQQHCWAAAAPVEGSITLSAFQLPAVLHGASGTTTACLCRAGLHCHSAHSRRRSHNTGSKPGSSSLQAKPNRLLA